MSPLLEVVSSLKKWGQWPESLQGLDTSVTDLFTQGGEGEGKGEEGWEKRRGKCLSPLLNSQLLSVTWFYKAWFVAVQYWRGDKGFVRTDPGISIIGMTNLHHLRRLNSADNLGLPSSTDMCLILSLCLPYQGEAAVSKAHAWPAAQLPMEAVLWVQHVRCSQSSGRGFSQSNQAKALCNSLVTCLPSLLLNFIRTLSLHQTEW